jgi:hypothetical protein
VARLLALALRLEELLRNGSVRYYADLARLGRVSSARISQIMNLRCLAPDIQEALLFLPPTRHGRAKLTVAHLQRVAAALDWPTQRRRWRALRAAKGLTDGDLALPDPEQEPAAGARTGAPPTDQDPQPTTGAPAPRRSASHAPA